MSSGNRQTTCVLTRNTLQGVRGKREGGIGRRGPLTASALPSPLCPPEKSTRINLRCKFFSPLTKPRRECWRGGACVGALLPSGPCSSPLLRFPPHATLLSYGSRRGSGGEKWLSGSLALVGSLRNRIRGTSDAEREAVRDRDEMRTAVRG